MGLTTLPVCLKSQQLQHSSQPPMDGGVAAAAFGETPGRNMDDTTSIVMDFVNTGESLPPRRSRRASAGRRVSFADTAKVHVFERDDEYETPPEAQTEEITKIGSSGKRRSPRLAEKHKRKESLEEARAALAPRFDVAIPSASTEDSPSSATQEWILQRDYPEQDSAEVEMDDETGPIDVRRLRNGDLTDDDVTGDTPLFADLLKEDNTATSGATFTCGQPQSAGEGGPLTYTASEYPMSMTYTPSKWPIELPHYALEDSPDSDMSLCSDFPMREMLQQVAVEVGSRREMDLVDVPVDSSQEYDKEMQATGPADMELVATADFEHLPSRQGKKAAKRRINNKSVVEPDESSATKKGRGSLLKSQRLVVSSSTGTWKVDKENLPPEILVPSRSSKQDVGKGRSGFPLKQRSDNVNVPELLTFDTQDPGTDGAKMTTEDEEVQLLRNHMTVLEREDQTWRDAKESQTELHGLAEDLQSTIASYGVKVRDEARSVLQPEDLVAKCSQVLEQIHLQEENLSSRELLLSQSRQRRKRIGEKLEETRIGLNSRTSKNTTFLASVRSQKEKLEMLQKVQRLRLRTTIVSEQQRQVLEVTYFDLICQRFFSEQEEPLVMRSSVAYLPEEIDKVFPDLNASRLFLSILPPSENIVLGAAKLIPGVVQETERTAWNLVKLMEELQDCKYKYLFYLSVPMIDGNDASDLGISLKFSELRIGLKFRVRIEIDVKSCLLNGHCQVDVDYLSKEARKHIAADTIVKTVKAVKPGYWRIRNICGAVQRLLDNLRSKPWGPYKPDHGVGT